MANNEIPKYYLECLKKDIEAKVGRSIDSYSDFNYLFLELRKVISDAPSVSTLKRLWSYVTDTSTRSRSTLNSLARFLGFTDWTNYVENLMRQSRIESDFLTTKTLVASSLNPGDIIEIEWVPDRRIQVVSLGENRFEVIKSDNAKLIPGMSFSAMMFSKGLPLMCLNVRSGDTCHESYVAGNKSGITSLKFIPWQPEKGAES